MIVGVIVGKTVRSSKLMKNTPRSAKMVCREDVSSVGEAESTEFKWNRMLSYGWLREGAVEVIKVDCLLEQGLRLKFLN